MIGIKNKKYWIASEDCKTVSEMYIYDDGIKFLSVCFEDTKMGKEVPGHRIFNTLSSATRYCDENDTPDTINMHNIPENDRRTIISQRLQI